MSLWVDPEELERVRSEAALAEYGKVCEHGSLKRQCRNCELAEEIETMVADAEKAERQLRAADVLAKAVSIHLRYVIAANPNISLDGMGEALAAYEKVRNGK